MNINYRQSQFELFPTTAEGSNKEAKRPYLFSSLTLTLENIIILSIFLVLTMVFAFSLGVERGGRVASINTKGELREKTFAKIKKNISSLNNNNSPTIAKAAVTVPMTLFKSTREVPKENPKITKRAPKNIYTIQVASFKTEEYAEKEANILREKKYVNGDVFVIPKGDYSIVCIGSFSQKSKAEVLLTKLKKKYKDCLVRRL